MRCVAQSVEHWTSDPLVPGSNLGRGTFLKIEADFLLSSAPMYVSSQEPVKKAGHGETAWNNSMKTDSTSACRQSVHYSSLNHGHSITASRPNIQSYNLSYLSSYDKDPYSYTNDKT